MTDCPDIRLGVPEDAPAVLDLCYRLASENAAFPVNYDKVGQVVTQALSRTGSSMMGVSGKVGEPVKGCICIDMVTQWYSDIPFLTDVFNYVSPEHRKSTLARQQLAFAKMVADEFNMPLFVAILTSKRTAAKVRLYEREFVNVGGQFAYFPEKINHLFDQWTM